MKKRIPIIIDTDIGSDVDDILALMYALQQDVIDLVAISTVYGKTKLRSEIAKHILKTFKKDAIPVFQGLSTPLTPDVKIWETNIEGEGLLEQEVIESSSDYSSGDLGELYSYVMEYVKKNTSITLLCIGPLTNIAYLLSTYPEIKECIKALVIMGGNFQSEGLHKEFIEHNFKSDPIAVDIVLKSGLPITILGADVTYGATFDRDDLSVLKESNNPVLQDISREVEKWFGFCRREFHAEKDITYLHDPLTLYYLLNPSAFQTMQCDISIVSLGKDKGRVSVKNNTASSTTIVAHADLESFKSHMMATFRKMSD